MIMPFSSISTVWVIAETAYGLISGESHFFRSDTCDHGNPSAAMACFPLSTLSSSETPRLLKPLGWYFSYNFTTWGFSRRQGPPQEAQQSIRVIFPFPLERANDFTSGCLPATTRAFFP